MQAQARLRLQLAKVYGGHHTLVLQTFLLLVYGHHLWDKRNRKSQEKPRPYKILIPTPKIRERHCLSADRTFQQQPSTSKSLLNAKYSDVSKMSDASRLCLLIQHNSRNRDNNYMHILYLKAPTRL